MKNFLKLATVVVAMLGACSKTGVTPPEKHAHLTISVDLSTPDRAIKSYWAVRDSVRSNQHEVITQAMDALARAEAQTIEVSEGALAKELVGRQYRLEMFARDILDVKVESESRAVITALIKNSTPIPAGTELTKYDEELRTKGERYRYVLEKVSAGWRIVEIWQWDTYPSLGWKKFRPIDGKPYVPSLTYEGS